MFDLVKAHKSIIWLECFDYGFIMEIIEELCRDETNSINAQSIRIWSNVNSSVRDLDYRDRYYGGFDTVENEGGSYVYLDGNEVQDKERKYDKLKRYSKIPKKATFEESIIKFIEEKGNKLFIARISEPMFTNDNGRIVSALQEFVFRNNQKKDIDKLTVLLIASNHFNLSGLEHICEHLTMPLPDKIDIQNELGWFIENGKIKNPNDKPKYNFATDFLVDKEKNYEELVNALYGMHLYDIRELLHTIISESKYNKIHSSLVLDEDGDEVELKKRIEERKKQMVKNTGLLEVIDYEEDYYKFVGDIENLTKHINNRKLELENPSFLESQLPKPKGILLVGAPGCGKSESVKAVASILKFPLYRLNIGGLLGHKYGQSENQFIEALRTADASAPCVLWIDEIEKAFAGAGNEQENDDTLTHIVGYFLTWMQEHKTLVYLVATANNLSKMRPEMLRKGRWDEIFYLTYPSDDGRKKIFVSCILKYGLCFITKGKPLISKKDKNKDSKELSKLIEDIDLTDLTSHMRGMSGAEISNLIINMARNAHREGKPDQVSKEDLDQYFDDTKDKNQVESDQRKTEQINESVKRELREIEIRCLGREIPEKELKELKRLLYEKHKDEIENEHFYKEYESKGYISASRNPSGKYL